MVVRKYEGYSGRMICGTLEVGYDGRGICGTLEVGDMRDIIGEMRWGICGTDHLPEIGPAGLPFLVHPPRQQRLGDRNGKRSTSRKKECLFCI